MSRAGEQTCDCGGTVWLLCGQASCDTCGCIPADPHVLFIPPVTDEAANDAAWAMRAASMMLAELGAEVASPIFESSWWRTMLAWNFAIAGLCATAAARAMDARPR